MHDHNSDPRPTRRVDATPYVGTQPAQFAPAPYVAPQPVIPQFGAQPAPGYAQPYPPQQPPAYPVQHAPPAPPAYQPPQPAAAPAAVAAAQGAPQAMKGEAEDYSVVEFSKPYRAHDMTVQSVKLRKPLAREIRKFGNPLRPRMDAGGIADVEMNWDAICNYVVALSDPPLPPSTVEQFEYFDLDACAGGIARFFVRL